MESSYHEYGYRSIPPCFYRRRRSRKADKHLLGSYKDPRRLWAVGSGNLRPELSKENIPHSSASLLPSTKASIAHESSPRLHVSSQGRYHWCWPRRQYARPPPHTRLNPRHHLRRRILNVRSGAGGNAGLAHKYRPQSLKRSGPT